MIGRNAPAANYPKSVDLTPLLILNVCENVVHLHVMKQSHTHPGRGPCPDAWQAAQQYGIDMSALLANLDKTVLERIRNHDRAVAMAAILRQAVADRHGQL